MIDLPERYEFPSLIAQNSNCQVYKCRDGANGHSIAIKVWSSADAEVIESVKSQFKILSGLIHPHIIKVIESGLTGNGYPYLATEWLDNGNLDKAAGGLSPEDKIIVMTQLAECLDFLHSIEYIHGDIKPGNILISSDDTGQPRIKLTDFEFLEPGGYLSRQAWKGTPAYMAPEIVRGEPIGYSADMYSLGVLFFHLLTGRLPFDEQDLHSLAYAHLDKQASFTATEITNLKPEMTSFILDLLEKNPHGRPESAWRVRDFLLKDSEQLKQADRVLAHSVVDHCLKYQSPPDLNEQFLHKTLDKFFKGIDSDRKVSGYLIEKSGANREIIADILRQLIECNLILRESGRWTVKTGFETFTLPPELLTQYLPGDLSALSHQAQRILEVASVFKYEVSLEALKNLGALPESEFNCGLEELVKTGWIRKLRIDEDETFRYLKGSDRDFILNRVSNEIVSSLRRQVTELLEDSQDLAEKPEILKELLFQSQMSGNAPHIHKYASMLSDWADCHSRPAEALEYALIALHNEADQPAQRARLLLRVAELYHAKGLSREAVRYYLDFLSTQPPKTVQSAEAQEKLGLCYAHLGDFISAERHLNSAIEYFSQESTKEKLAKALLDHTVIKRMQGLYSESEEILEKCGRLICDGKAPQLQAQYYHLKGVLDWFLGRYESATQNFSKSLEAYSDLQLEPEIGHVHNNLGLTLRDWDKPVEALDHLQRGLKAVESVGDKIRISSSLNNLALTFKDLKRNRDAIEHAKMALAMAQEISFGRVIALAHNNLAFFLIATGSLNLALHHVREAISGFKELKDDSGLGLAYYNQAEIYRTKELKELAEEYYLPSLSLRRKLGENLGIADCLAGLSRLYLENSAYNRSEEYLNEALHLYRTLKKRSEISTLHLAKAEALILSGNVAGAEEALRETEEGLTDNDAATVQSYRNLVEGLLNEKYGDYDSAELRLRLALNVFADENDKKMRAKACLYLGSFFKNRGQLRTAERYWRESLGLYRELDVKSKIEQLEDWMSDLKEADDKSFEHVQTLSKMSFLLAYIQDEQTFLESSLKLSMELLGAERGAILIYEEKTGDFEVKVAFRLEEDTTSDVLEISKRTVRQVFQTGKSLISENSLSDPLLSNHLSIKTHNILSIVCTPLSFSDKVIGALYLDNRSLTRAFTLSDRAFIDALSNLLSVGIVKAQSYSRVIEELAQLRRASGKFLEFPNIVGSSSVMQEIFSMVSKIVNSKASVLLFGESGTGKEVIANLIHSQGERKNSPFIRVNCAALPESLLESELFGIEEKVASGVKFREGKFKQADGGTIFLDEIGDMSLSTQSKVLRVLQEQEFERVGGSKTVKVDIRVIAATNKDLQKLIDNNEFRHDLYYRLNTVNLVIPPLRERKEDIPLLVIHFLEKFTREDATPSIKIDAPVMQALCNYYWPGNVRELMNLIHRGILFAENGEINLGQLPPELLQNIQEKTKPTRISKLKDHLIREEKTLITVALKQCDWNQSKASRLLGIPQSSLARKIKKYKIKKPASL